MPGFPIQKSPDQRVFSPSPKLIAAFHVFHRHLTPRHPPFALSSLATIPQISLNALMRTYSPALPALMQTCAGQYPASFGSTTGIHCVFSTSRHTAADYDIYYNKLSKNIRKQTPCFVSGRKFCQTKHTRRSVFKNHGGE